jgi:anionic cell wall polymer biosynthesis LytR-Cps2A-Psr (LCP) family protein
VASTVATIESNFGITIDGTVMTEMSDFAVIVDAIGGVEVNNPVAVSDPAFGDFPAGPITIDGAGAVAFSRVVGEEGTPGRIARQQALLVGILNQLILPEVVAQLPTVIVTLTGAVQTDIPANIQAELVAAAVSFAPDDIVFNEEGEFEDQLEVVSTDEAGAQVYAADWATLPGFVESWLAGGAG